MSKRSLADVCVKCGHPAKDHSREGHDDSLVCQHSDCHCIELRLPALLIEDCEYRTVDCVTNTFLRLCNE